MRPFIAFWAGLLAGVLVALAAAPVASAEPAYRDLLDLPVRDDGSAAGGLNPALPLDLPALQAAVEQARADDVPPRRYATLLEQYWLVVATGHADIDLGGWDPGRGVAANSRTFTQVYVNYLRLATEHPEFAWAGLAGLAGGSFAAGYFDMGDIGAAIDLPGIHQLGSAVADLLARTPAPRVDLLPPDVRLLGLDGPRLTADDLAWYQTRLLVMQKHIFLDQVPMHEAYAAGGLPAVEEMYRAGVLDDNALAAWHSVAAGTAAGDADALQRMTDREQNQIVAAQWDETAGGRGAMGRVMTYVSTLVGKAAVPGVRAPGVYRPVTLSAEVDGRPATLRTALPDFDWADRAPRWQYITADLLPRYTDLRRDPVVAHAVVAEPFLAKLARGRMVPRLPDLLADLTDGWQLGW
ncbi:hypothetical protein [Nocardia sp. alder85J]|uniref:hypothetical protein n=1 Tax=Nocardia sp. alder85J TaxID=2862949 RepID=UPI001CD35377|nr:hypothetical protein [Nocardia sp. alder85J]MCX4094906.1 hypothetical protein [Nocardia sp. alder85J]